MVARKRHLTRSEISRGDSIQEKIKEKKLLLSLYHIENVLQLKKLNIKETN